MPSPTAERVLSHVREKLAAKALVRRAVSRLSRKLLVGGALLGTGATLAGAASAAKQEAARPLAPPNQHPPGY